MRIGIDIGGTFTDIVALRGDGQLLTKKVPSSSDNYGRAILKGLEDMFGEHGADARSVAEVRHGTTIASNTILEHKGARTGLITTKGFRDVLEIRNLRMPRLYDITWQKPAPLIERYLRLTVDERIDTHGAVLAGLDPGEAERAVDRLLAFNVEAIAVCFLNSFANPVHELLVKEIISRRAPDLPCCISYDVLPEIKEYERTSTTVINTYVMPAVAKYLSSLHEDLRGIGLDAPLLLMQSNGGLTTADEAIRQPMHIIESGPAAGVIGAQALARTIGLSDLVTFDMGGTTAKAALIENGQVARSLEHQVGGGIMIGSRLLTGAGYTLKVPAIDLAEVGAGGGSIVWIDAGGTIQIGPQSAGAMPGPACYDMGGTEPTVTDANILLGYLNPSYLVGGGLRLNAERAGAVFNERICKPLGISSAHAAYGAHQIAASNMIRAIKAVSSERGRDPRRFTLLAFGGNGPLFAAGMARTLGMGRVIVPPSPGLFSSFGLLYSGVEYYHTRSFRRLLRRIDLAELDAAFNSLAGKARNQLAASGFHGAAARIRRNANLHYQGQTYELPVPLADGPLDEAAIAHLAEAFGQEHELTYGHRASAEEPVELVSIQVVGYGVSDRPAVPDGVRIRQPSMSKHPPMREAYFGPEAGWLSTPVLDRADLVEMRDGPVIIEEYDATCVVPPGMRVCVDGYGNIAIDVM